CLVPPGRGYGRRNPKGENARRSAGAGADSIRNGAQPQDRQGAWPASAGHHPPARRRGDRMKREPVDRRSFLTLLGAAAAASSVSWPLAARGQQRERVRRIGALIGGGEDDAERQATLAEFKNTLSGLGWTDGRNLRIDVRFASSDTRRARALAAELVALKPDLLFGDNTFVIAELQQATRTIPIVFARVTDPVG